MCYLTSKSRLLGQLSTASCVNYFEQALLEDITKLFPSDTHFYCNISGSNNVHSAAFYVNVSCVHIRLFSSNLS